MFPFIKTWSIWFTFLPSGDLQVRLWMSHDLSLLSFITLMPNFPTTPSPSVLLFPTLAFKSPITTIISFLLKLETVSCSWFYNLSFSSSIASFVSAYASTTVRFLYFEYNRAVIILLLIGVHFIKGPFALGLIMVATPPCCTSLCPMYTPSLYSGVLLILSLST